MLHKTIKLTALGLSFFLATALLPLYGQETGHELISGKSIPALRKKEILTVPERLFSFLPLLGNKRPHWTPSQPGIPLYYRYEALGFFCKVEVQLEKYTRIPIKIRLGEVQYVERLEGKYP